MLRFRQACLQLLDPRLHRAASEFRRAERLSPPGSSTRSGGIAPADRGAFCCGGFGPWVLLAGLPQWSWLGSVAGKPPAGLYGRGEAGFSEYGFALVE